MRIKTLDIYILRTFIFSLLMCFMVLMVMRVLGDLTMNLDEFTEDDSISAWQTLWHITRYYMTHSLVYFSELGGIIIVVGAVFTVFRMNNSNELTAMLASGVSLHRVVWPIILAAILLSGLIVIDREYLIPPVRPFLSKKPDEMQSVEKFQVKFPADSERTVWFANLFDPNNEQMDYPLAIVRDKKYRYMAEARGVKAFPGEFAGEPGWIMEKGEILRQGGAKQEAWRELQRADTIYTIIGPEQISQYAKDVLYPKQHNGQPVPPGESISKVEDLKMQDPEFDMTLQAKLFQSGPRVKFKTPEGRIASQIITGELTHPTFKFKAGDRIFAFIYAEKATWVHGKPQNQHWKLENGTLFVPTDLSSEDLIVRQARGWTDYLSSRELGKLLASNAVQNPQAVRMTKYIRFAEPLNNLVMLLLGLPFILSRERNLKASAALCLLVVGIFFAFTYLCRYLGFNEFLSAFLPLLIFGPISVIMLDSVKT